MFSKKIILFVLFVACSFSLQAQNENRMLVCENSLEKVVWDLEFIAKAQSTIEICACYTGGQTMENMLDAFEKRLQEVPTLQVRMLISPLLLEERNKEHIARILKTYTSRFQIVYTSNVVNIFPNLAGIDNHSKFIVIDEYYFSAGGTNLEDALCSDGSFTPSRQHRDGIMGQNLPLGTRDADICGVGPLAKEMRKTFYKIYALWKYLGETSHFINDPEYFADFSEYWPVDPQLIPVVEKFDQCPYVVKVRDVRIIFSGTMHRPNRITQEYERLITNARQEIIIGNLYFCPVDSLLNSLMQAANRNVSLTVITNGISEIAPQYTEFFCWANRINYVPILYGQQFSFFGAQTAARMSLRNTKIYEYHVKDILYHKKVMIVDRRYLVIGSYNLGLRSDLGDYEIILCIDSPELAEREAAIMEREKALSVEVKPEDARYWYFDPIKAYIGGTQRQFHGFL